MTQGAGGLLPDRHPSAGFFVCDVLAAEPGDDLGSMELPVFSLSTRRTRARARHGAALLAPERLDEARALAPGADVPAPVAQWQNWWDETGSPRLTSTDRAFPGCVASRAGPS